VHLARGQRSILHLVCRAELSRAACRCCGCCACGPQSKPSLRACVPALRPPPWPPLPQSHNNRRPCCTPARPRWLSVAPAAADCRASCALYCCFSLRSETRLPLLSCACPCFACTLRFSTDDPIFDGYFFPSHPSPPCLRPCHHKRYGMPTQTVLRTKGLDRAGTNEWLFRQLALLVRPLP
jgi:hypothetical protein